MSFNSPYARGDGTPPLVHSPRRQMSLRILEKAEPPTIESGEAATPPQPTESGGFGPMNPEEELAALQDLASTILSDGVAAVSSAAQSFASVSMPHFEADIRQTPSSKLSFAMSSTTGPSGVLSRYRIQLIGDAGSGKTSLKQCVINPVASLMKTLPDTTPSIACSSSVYYHTTNRAERVEMTVVDGGPIQLAFGLTLYFRSGGMFVLCINLSTVKQGKKKSVNDVFVHDQLMLSIRKHVAAVTCTAPQSPIVLVGTHMDMLSDTSVSAIERVLAKLHNIVTEELEKLHSCSEDGYLVAPRLVACYAVSCMTSSCISENRGGPSTIQEMWSFVCDVAVKYLRMDRKAVDPVHVSMTQQLLHKARTELHIPYIARHVLSQLMYRMKITSHSDREATLQSLCNCGDVVMLRKHRSCPGGDIVVLTPQLVSRVIIAFVMAFSGSAERLRFVGPTIAAALEAADPLERVSREGVVTQQVIDEFAAVISQHSASAIDRSSIVRRVFLMADFMVELHDRELQMQPLYTVPSLSSATFSPAKVDSLFDMLRSQTAACESHVLGAVRRFYFVPFAPHVFSSLVCRVGSRGLIFVGGVYVNAALVFDETQTCRCVMLLHSERSIVGATTATASSPFVQKYDVTRPLAVDLLFFSLANEGESLLLNQVHDVVAEVREYITARCPGCFVTAQAIEPREAFVPIHRSGPAQHSAQTDWESELKPVACDSLARIDQLFFNKGGPK